MSHVPVNPFSELFFTRLITKDSYLLNFFFLHRLVCRNCMSVEIGTSFVEDTAAKSIVVLSTLRSWSISLFLWSWESTATWLWQWMCIHFYFSRRDGYFSLVFPVALPPRRPSHFISWFPSGQKNCRFITATLKCPSEGAIYWSENFFNWTSLNFYKHVIQKQFWIRA